MSKLTIHYTGVNANGLNTEITVEGADVSELNELLQKVKPTIDALKPLPQKAPWVPGGKKGPPTTDVAPECPLHHKLAVVKVFPIGGPFTSKAGKTYQEYDIKKWECPVPNCPEKFSVVPTQELIDAKIAEIEANKAKNKPKPTK